MTLRVMLVDDNEDDLFFTRLALKRSGDQLEVTSFDRAQDALDWLQTEQGRDLHLILLDINPRWPPQTAPLMATQTAPGRTVGL